MKRIIYSFYIDIPEKELDIFDKDVLKKDEVPRNIVTKKQFKDNYFKLLANKKWYAESIGVPFMMFEYDLRYQKFEKEVKKYYPFITTYNVVNFYKLNLLYMKIADQIKININEQDVYTFIAKKYPTESESIIEKIRKDEKYLNQIKNQILENDIIKHIKEKCKLNKIKKSFTEVMN